jgi:hypothetical protein
MRLQGTDTVVIHEHAELERDLKALLRRADRRDVLRWLATASVIPLIGCGGSGDSITSGSDGGVSSCSKIPEETQGPYPGDGSNGPNVLALSGIVRSDIRSSIGSASGVADGVPLTVELTLVNSNSGATSSSNKIATSQMALPKTACDAVYATSAYSGSASNLSQVSLASDNVFSDGSSTELASMSGSLANGYQASLVVGVAR